MAPDEKLLQAHLLDVLSGMAAAAALHPCSIGHSCKLLVATLMLLLAASAILLRNSKHRSAAHQLGRGFTAGTTQSALQVC